MEKENDVWTEAVSQYFPDGNWELKPVPGGLNNLTKYVETPKGTYVMRIYQNGYGIEKILYEHKVLKELQNCSFSFQTPRIYPTVDGKDYAITSCGNQAVMFYLIPGHHPDENNLVHIRELGRVAGELINGYGKLKIDMPCPTHPYYELYKLHPSVPDKQTLVDAMKGPVLDVVREKADFLMGEIFALEEAISKYHDTLPKINIHGDFWIGNLLIQDDKVTAILDFEFAAVDWRALEVGICVSRFPNLADPWANFNAFIEGFRKTCSITEEEIQAIPGMIKLRTLTNVIHFVGRYLAGLDSANFLTDRISGYYKRIGWINENSAKIVETFQAGLANAPKDSQ